MVINIHYKHKYQMVQFPVSERYTRRK